MKRRKLRCKLLLLLSLMVCSGTVQAQEKTVLSLTLDKAIEIALAENPMIQVADKEIALKKTANSETWQNLLPQASIGAALDHTIKAAEMKLNGMSFKMGQDHSNTVNGGLSISLPLFAPSVYKAMSLTRTDVELALEKARSSRLDMVNQVTKAYYQLMLAQDSYVVLQKSYQLTEENYQVVKAKFDQGTVSEYDKISAEVQMRSVKPSVIAAENAINLAKLQLKVLMGITEDVDVVIDDSLSNYEEFLYGNEINESSNENALANNSTMKQMDLNVKLLEKNIKVQRMNYVPMLSLGFNYQFQSLYNDNLRFLKYDWANSSSLTLNLSIPLFKASNATKVRSAKIQLTQMQLNRINTERSLNMQIENYRNSMEASSEQVASNRENVAQAQKAVDIAGKRYEVGRGTVLELNSSQVSLTQAQLTYSQSIFDYLVAKADLDKVLGREYISGQKAK